ncbi:hypothetical protein Cni_G10577 [Canna indica]|uniref:Protein PHYTOCHROME KINASE SUBSTRATE 4 n=1 Tax=Canna indica TaxID=4628 RepID=A0AAQ3QAT1_9LILI|nr:hypothetical protein Cni_G10577 [Canna indica]
MERYGVSANFPRRPSALQTPPSFIYLPPKPHLGEPPISAYLHPEVPRPAAGIGSLDRRFGRCDVDDTDQISIFDAERYFNDGHDAIKRTIILDGLAERCDLYQRDSSSLDGDMRHGRSFSLYSTPTDSSEASWNSQSVLLGNPPVSAAFAVGALPLKDVTSSPTSAGRRLFGFRCPCSGRKSVDVEEKCSEPKSPTRSRLNLNSSVAATNLTLRAGEVGLSSIPERATPEGIKSDFSVEEMIKVKITPGNCPKGPNFFSNSTRFSPPPERTFTPEVGRKMVNSGNPCGDNGGFSFPVLNPPSLIFAEESPRKSLEAFRPTKETAAALSTPPELQRRAVVFPFFPKPPPDDDVASDASSDLFEIESFSTQPAYRRRDSLDKIPRGFDSEAPPTPSIAPSECYAPSEVSIEWSVTTAEGFDRASLANFSSAASDCGDPRFVQADRERFAAAMGGSSRRRCSGLLSCRSQKAVSVGPNPVLVRAEAVRQRMNRAR